jgi:PKD repeat protein
VATFFDESSPGTQTITSELVDFGDGSTPEAIANDASVQHAYAAPGAYTATLSVTDALGTVSSTTTLVVIDP